MVPAGGGRLTPGPAPTQGTDAKAVPLTGLFIQALVATLLQSRQTNNLVEMDDSL